MFPITSFPPSILFQVGGVASYILFFHHGERHLFPWRYVGGVALLQCLTTIAITFTAIDTTTNGAALLAAKLVANYLLGLYTTLILFRLFFNPLNKFPGPFMARLTALHHSFQVGRKMDMYLHLQDAHRKWGDFVRIAPNTLSVADPRVVSVALGGQSKCGKAPWYSAEHPAYSMHSTRSREDHDARRRIWSSAFSDKALRGYEMRVQKYNELLVQQIKSFSGKPYISR